MHARRLGAWQAVPHERIDPRRPRRRPSARWPAAGARRSATPTRRAFAELTGDLQRHVATLRPRRRLGRRRRRRRRGDRVAPRRAWDDATLDELRRRPGGRGGAAPTPRPSSWPGRRSPTAAEQRDDPDRPEHQRASRGGARPSSTRSTSAASPTATATGSATCPAIRSRLPYLRQLGVDAVWLNPFYPSPQADAGYDVADYRDVDPAVRHARRPRRPDRRRPRPRHPRDRRHRAQPHVRRARLVPRRAGAPDRAVRERARYLFRDGRGTDGDAAAQRLGQRCSAVPAWTRVIEADGRPGQWYLHLFDRKQPDLDWTQPGGPRGVPVDPALLVRPRRRRLPHRRRPRAGQGPGDARSRRPASRPAARPTAGTRTGTSDEVHDVYREWRRVSDSVRRRPGVRRRGVGGDARAPRPLPAARRAAHRVQLRLPPRAVGRRRAAAGDRRRASTRSSGSARRRRGCCRTTTSSATSRATAAASSAGGVPGPPRC